MSIIKQYNPPLLDQNSQYVLGGISSFELKTITISNSKPHRLFDHQFLILMKQHFVFQIFVMMKQHFFP
jgi:hypothetical protein